MNKNVLIVLAGGFLIAVLVAVLVNASLNGDKEQSASVGGETSHTEVLVATKNLAIGREVTSSDMKWQSWPQESLFPGAVVREGEEEVSEIISGRLNQSVSEGQPLLRGYMVKESKGNFMAASLGAGMRAVGVSVKAETMAGGFIGPGDFVDVILTYKVRIRDRENVQITNTISEYASETLLENVRVLAVDQTAEREEDKANVGRTATLEVNALQAEELSLASEMGDITLSLRSLGDEAIVTESNITTDVKMSRILKNIARMESSSNGSGGIVRVYNGGVVQNVPVRQNIVLED